MSVGEEKRQAATDRRAHRAAGVMGLSPILSARELEILQLVSYGDSGPEVALVLHLSPETIKSHLSTIYRKLGARERAAAVAEGMRRGLIT